MSKHKGVIKDHFVFGDGFISQCNNLIHLNHFPTVRYQESHFWQYSKALWKQRQEELLKDYKAITYGFIQKHSKSHPRLLIHKELPILLSVYSNNTRLYYDSENPPTEELTRVSNLLKEEESKNKIQLVMFSNGRYFLREANLKDLDIDIDLNYHNLNYKKLVDTLSSDGSGLLFFCGTPGTGKTTLVKHLTSVLKKQFVFLTTTLAGNLDSPDFLTFAMENLQDSILVIEDAERLLASRKTSSNSAISTLLNVTDGIIGEALNLKIIASQNYMENTDEAFLREGRMLFRHEFQAIPADQATRLSKKLGHNITYTEEVELCKVYSPNVEIKTPTKAKIGF